MIVAWLLIVVPSLNVVGPRAGPVGSSIPPEHSVQREIDESLRKLPNFHVL